MATEADRQFPGFQYGMAAAHRTGPGGPPPPKDACSRPHRRPRYRCRGRPPDLPALCVDGPADVGPVVDGRYLSMGMSISSGAISRTSSGIAHSTSGSTLILKWYIDCNA